MSEGPPIHEASAQLDALVTRARTGGEHVILTVDDAPVAAIIGIQELRELQEAQDAADIAECLRSQAEPGPRYTHDEVMAILAADAAAAGE